MPEKRLIIACHIPFDGHETVENMIKKQRPVYGVGINDAGYPASIQATINGRRSTLWMCPFYDAWKHMLARCYSAKRQVKFPTYAGCTVAAE